VRAGPTCTDDSARANQLALLCGTGSILSHFATSKGTVL
jgi:hypothetical protein